MDISTLAGGLGTMVFIVFMVLITVVPTLLITGAALFFTFKVLSKIKADQQENTALLGSGIPATARITQISMGSMTVRSGVSRSLQVNLTVEVTGLIRPDGSTAAPYTTPLTTMIPELAIPRIQPGSEVPVRVDPADQSRIAIDLPKLGYA